MFRIVLLQVYAVFLEAILTITMSLIRDGQTPSKSYRKKEQ